MFSTQPVLTFLSSQREDLLESSLALSGMSNPIVRMRLFMPRGRRLYSFMPTSRGTSNPLGPCISMNGSVPTSYSSSQAAFFSGTLLSHTTTSEQPKAVNETKEKKSSLLDREAINTESNEYSKSGSDASAATQEDPAFSPAKTHPDSEFASSQPTDKGGRDPLEMSPANADASQTLKPDEGGAGSGPRRSKGSGGGGGEVKAKKVG